jgi:hypothetical protein
MLVGDQVIGVITAVSFDPKKEFTTRDAQLYARIGAVAGVVVEKTRRLALIDSAKRGGSPPATLTSQERDERELAQAVARLIKERPDRVRKTIDVLRSVEAFL